MFIKVFIEMIILIYRVPPTSTISMSDLLLSSLLIMVIGNWEGTDVALKKLKNDQQFNEFMEEASLLRYS